MQRGSRSLRTRRPRRRPGARLPFTVTAYCKGTRHVRRAGATGIAAADPELLPVGSVVQVDRRAAALHGIYTVMDTGPAVQGRELDIYMWSCNEALAVRPPGGHRITVAAARLESRATTPGFMERLFAAARASRRQPLEAVSRCSGSARPTVRLTQTIH